MAQNNNSILNPALSHNADWQNATGPVQIRMTNDYLFRALLQRNNNVLKHLICSLLHLKPCDVLSVRIMNPIILGKNIDSKNFILDIKIELNENTVINLEMQVINEHNWPERSLSYLCRSFDNLNKGTDYLHVKSAIQIGLLDFTLFEHYPEFFATYQLLNVKNHHLYSDKLRLSVLDLTQIKLATEEDMHYGIHHWARLFKSTTWEDIKMIAKSDDFIQEAASTVYQLTQEEQIRQQCEAREEFIRIQNTQRLYQEQLERDKAQLTQDNAQLTQDNAQLSQKLSQANAEIEKLKKQLAAKE